MKSRVVLFKGQTNWLMSPVFYGDKTELAQSSATRSCDKNWTTISRKFMLAKTKDEFAAVSKWAQELYHDTAAPTEVKPVTIYKSTDDVPDELLVVYEDLATTGIHVIGECSVCGRTHVLVCRPDKTINTAGGKCLTCGGKLFVRGTLPGLDAWGAILDKYQLPAPSFRIAVPDDFPHIKETLRKPEVVKKDKSLETEEGVNAAAKEWLSEIMKDHNAVSHMGEPVKISKIVGYSGDEFLLEVIFKDWSSAIVRERFLIRYQAPEA